MAMFVDGQDESLSLRNGYMTGMGDDWRVADRRPAELRSTMAKMNVKGKENVIESNEDVEMLDGDEDPRRRSTLINHPFFLFLYFSRSICCLKLRTDHLNFSSLPRTTANAELVLKMSLHKVLVIGGSRPRSTQITRPMPAVAGAASTQRRTRLKDINRTTTAWRV